MRNAVDNRDFILIEYQRSFDAFYKGIDIGFSFVRFYFIINGLFLASIGVFLRVDLSAMAPSVNVQLDWLAVLIPVIGIVFSSVLLFYVKQYNAHLDNCSSRCAEIERELGGKLFVELKQIDASHRLKSIHSFYIVFGAFLLLWIAVLRVALLQN